MAEHPAATAQSPGVLREADLQLQCSPAWSRLPLLGAVVAVAGLGLAVALGRGEPMFLWRAWLLAALFALSIALGALFFVLIHHATQAGWSVSVRRLAENTTATLPLVGLLFVPLLLQLHALFPWSDANLVAHDPLLAHKHPLLNAPFFVARTVLYFAVWSGLALWFGAQSRRQDATGEHEITRRLRRASAPSLILFALTVTFFSFDWLMALDSHWYSTIFGVYFFSGCLVAGFAFLAIVAIAQLRSGLLTGAVNIEHLHELSKLLFAFGVAFWAYIGFSQYFLIWYGNLPEETSFFTPRLQGSWLAVSASLAVGHFALPFCFLMPRTVKRHPMALLAASLWMLVMQVVDLYWLVMPGLRPASAAPRLVDLLALVGASGAFLAAFGWASRRQALVPLRDPRLHEALVFENV
jgi:hypothetical protein